jgi:hypothetical protein
MIKNVATFPKVVVTTSAKDNFSTLCKAKNLNKNSFHVKNLQNCPIYTIIESK